MRGEDEEEEEEEEKKVEEVPVEEVPKEPEDKDKTPEDILDEIFNQVLRRFSGIEKSYVINRDKLWKRRT